MCRARQGGFSPLQIYADPNHRLRGRLSPFAIPVPEVWHGIPKSRGVRLVGSGGSGFFPFTRITAMTSFRQPKVWIPPEWGRYPIGRVPRLMRSSPPRRLLPGHRFPDRPSSPTKRKDIARRLSGHLPDLLRSLSAPVLASLPTRLPPPLHRPPWKVLPWLNLSRQPKRAISDQTRRGR